MRYLLDTNIISELGKIRPDPHVLAWCQDSRHQDACFLSVITLGELRQGIEKLRPADPVRATLLLDRIATLEHAYQGRILAIDVNVAHAWGQLAQRHPHHPIDAYLAATAQTHGLTLVTRNTRDFVPFGVPLVNPFLPESAAPQKAG